MLELPRDGQGLSWITNQGSNEMLLIPGLQTASITAASAGDTDALAYLRFTAQQFAAMGSHDQTLLDSLCTAASKVKGSNFHELPELQNTEELGHVYLARRKYTIELSERAAQEGQTAALQWLQALCHRTWSDQEGLMEAAARHGHLSTLQCLRSGPNPAPWDEGVLLAAAGHADCFEWLLTQKDPCPRGNDIVIEMAAAGNMQGLELLRHNADPPVPLDEWSAAVTCAAAAAGNLPVLQWLRMQVPPVPWDEDVCTAAAERNDLSMLEWVRGQDPPCPWDSVCTSEAAGNGNMDMLKWMQAQQPPCPFTAFCTSRAAEAGRLNVLQWLRREVMPPCPWSGACTRAATQHGQFDMLRWLRAEDPPCPWAGACTLDVVRSGKLTELEWLLAQEPPCPVHSSCAKEAVRRGDLQMVQLLSNHGHKPYGHLYLDAAQLGHVHILRWLHRTKVPASHDSSEEIFSMAISSSLLLFLGDVSIPLPAKLQARLTQARKRCCTFYGLLRWCRQAVSDPSRGINRAFSAPSTNASGQNLLVRLCMLPPEVLEKISLAAGLRHTLFQDSSDDHLYPRPEYIMTHLKQRQIRASPRSAAQRQLNQ